MRGLATEVRSNGRRERDAGDYPKQWAVRTPGPMISESPPTDRYDDAFCQTVMSAIDDADKRATVVPHSSKEAARCRENVHL